MFACLEIQSLQQEASTLGVRSAVPRRIVRRDFHQFGKKLGLCLPATFQIPTDSVAELFTGFIEGFFSSGCHGPGTLKFSMKRARTRAPARASASAMASAGWWLMPSLQRTNSIAISAMACIAMPS